MLERFLKSSRRMGRSSLAAVATLAEHAGSNAPSELRFAVWHDGPCAGEWRQLGRQGLARPLDPSYLNAPVRSFSFGELEW